MACFEALPLALCLTRGPEGTIVAVNGAFSKVLGVAENSSVGHTLDQFVSAQDSDTARRLLQGLHTGSDTTLWKGHRSSGEVLSISSYTLAPGGSANLLHVLAPMGASSPVDATLREALKRAEEADRAKQTFLATLSHELRTPLNSVVGYASILREATNLTGEQRQFVEGILTSSEAMLEQINQILDFSRIAAGHIELAETDFDLARCVTETVSLLHAKAQEKGLQLLSSVDSAIPERVVGDRSRLRQVLLNLLSNAVNHTEHGRVQCKVSSLRGTDRYRFEISDTGPGIPEEDREKIFEPYMQSKRKRKRVSGDNSGLGLAICRNLVTLMGGEIGVVSTLGEGSTFWFTLPLTNA